MVDLWVHDIESLEAVTQDEHTKRICLRMAAMSQAGTLAPFIANLHYDDDLDDHTKGTIAEIAMMRTSCSRSRTTSGARASSTEPLATIALCGRLAQLVRAPL